MTRVSVAAPDFSTNRMQAEDCIKKDYRFVLLKEIKVEMLKMQNANCVETPAYLLFANEL